MIVLVPYFGDTARFQPLLDQWWACFRKVFPNESAGAQAVLLTDPESADAVKAIAEKMDDHGRLGICEMKVAGFSDLMRVAQPFDRKGALVCAYLLAHEYPTLVLDADAFLNADPTAVLRDYSDCPVAMPIDHGALMYFRDPTFDPPFTGIRKLCAGVQFFPYVKGARSRLVAGYRRAFEEIVALPKVPWTPQLDHLVEQYAWSICHHRRGGKVLPPAMNWAPAHLGEDPRALINHHFGHPKWKTLGVKAPANT